MGGDWVSPGERRQAQPGPGGSPPEEPNGGGNPVADSDSKAAAGSPDQHGTAVLDGISRYGVVIALLLMLVAFSIALPHTFPTGGNAKTIVNSAAVTMLLALAATIPLRAGDFDLSIAGTMIVSAATVAQLTAGKVSWVLALIIVLAVGATIGAINAFLIVVIGLNGFVATLGSLTALEGLALAITGGQVISVPSVHVVNFTTHNFLGLQAMTWYVWVIGLTMWYLFERTPSGRYLLFIGGNPRSALLAGLSVRRIRSSAFIWCGILSALAGFLYAGSIGSIDATVAGQYLLQPYAAAFLGATTIAVGRFNALGTIVGLYLLTVGIAGLQLFGASNWVTNVFNGLALIAAITFARLATIRRGTG
jgi:ribose transport system permease protein